MKPILLITLLSFAASSFAADYFFGTKRRRETKNKLCKYDISLPRLKVDDGNEAQNEVVDQLNSLFEEEERSLIKQYRDALSEDPERCRDHNMYEIGAQGHLQTRTDRTIISVSYRYHIFDGSTSPELPERAQTFNATTGERYENLSAFFSDDKMGKFRRALKVAVKEADGLPENLEGYFEDNPSFANIENFYFTDSGLSLFFERAQLNLNTEAPITAEIGWSALRKIGVRADSPLARYPEILSEDYE